MKITCSTCGRTYDVPVLTEVLICDCGIATTLTEEQRTDAALAWSNDATFSKSQQRWAQEHFGVTRRPPDYRY